MKTILQISDLGLLILSPGEFTPYDVVFCPSPTRKQENVPSLKALKLTKARHSGLKKQSPARKGRTKNAEKENLCG